MAMTTLPLVERTAAAFLHFNGAAKFFLSRRSNFLGIFFETGPHRTTTAVQKGLVLQTFYLSDLSGFSYNCIDSLGIW